MLKNKHSQIIIIGIIFFVIMNSCISSSSNDLPLQIDSITIIHSREYGTISHHSSVDLVKFDEFYKKHPERWKKAFQFFKDNDVSKLNVGRYDLDGDNLFVNIDEYETRDEQDCKYESHRKYADIQYLVHGVEKIGLTQLEEVEEIEPYNSQKDIVFYKSPKTDVYHIADSSHFFIFFPEDVHRPCVKTDKKEWIRKAVVKVKLD